MEIERQFKVDEVPFDLREYEGKKYLQFYTHVTGDEEKRYRRIGEDTYIYTEKKGKGLEREEKEVNITEEEFNEAKENSKGRVEKTRYKIPYKEYTMELDVYHGDLNGFKSVEVEFPSTEKSKGFEPPDWFGEEVTEDPRYKNKSLAVKGLPEEMEKKDSDG